MTREEELANRFTYHPPRGDQPHRYELIRDTGLNMARMIERIAPDSREKDLAVARIEEAVMWANAAIARHE